MFQQKVNDFRKVKLEREALNDCYNLASMAMEVWERICMSYNIDILYLVYVSFCECDIIIQFAVHLYDCTLYERSLQLNCFHNGFFTGPRYEPTNHYMLLH